MATTQNPPLQSPLANPPFVDPLGRLTPSALQTLQKLFNFLNTTFLMGSGAPNGAITASPPAIYLNTAGGANETLWVKESGVGTNTGWVAK